MAICGPYNGWPKAILEHRPMALWAISLCRPTGLRPVGLTNIREKKKASVTGRRSVERRNRKLRTKLVIPSGLIVKHESSPHSNPGGHWSLIKCSQIKYGPVKSKAAHVDQWPTQIKGPTHLTGPSQVKILDPTK